MTHGYVEGRSESVDSVEKKGETRMYLTLDQVVLVADKSRIRPGDPIIYERGLRGKRIFTTDAEPAAPVTGAARYGRLYFDVGERPCIVPGRWDWNDAGLAKDVVPPADSLESDVLCH
jgi:hypothetical protein